MGENYDDAVHYIENYGECLSEGEKSEMLEAAEEADEEDEDL